MSSVDFFVFFFFFFKQKTAYELRISDWSSDVCSSDLPAAVDERGDLAVRIGADEAARKLVALADIDQPGVIFGARMARREQFLEHHRDLHAIGRTERIKLERMLSDRQILAVRRPRARTVAIGETPAAFSFPRTSFRLPPLVFVGPRQHLG